MALLIHSITGLWIIRKFRIKSFTNGTVIRQWRIAIPLESPSLKFEIRTASYYWNLNIELVSSKISDMSLAKPRVNSRLSNWEGNRALKISSQIWRKKLGQKSRVATFLYDWTSSHWLRWLGIVKFAVWTSQSIHREGFTRTFGTFTPQSDCRMIWALYWRDSACHVHAYYARWKRRKS